MSYNNFDSMFNMDDLNKDVEQSSKNTGSYDEVPAGSYEVGVEKLELTASKSSGKPMVSIWFKIVAGKYSGQLIFMNQVVADGRGINICLNFLKSLDTKTVDVKWEGSFDKFAEMLSRILNEIDMTKLEYALEYGVNNKGYKTYKIKEVYEG